MKRYSYTSNSLEGEIILGYSEEGWIVTFDASQVTFKENQHESFLRNFPWTPEHLKKLVDGDAGRSMTEIVENVTFEMFWERYDHKTLSHKKKSQERWNKLSKTEQLKAYNHIPKYFRLLVINGTYKKNAETYLNAQLWNN